MIKARPVQLSFGQDRLDVELFFLLELDGKDMALHCLEVVA
jgi:hypothetical protein